LNIVSPDAVMRLKYTKLASEFQAVFDEYFKQQYHISLIGLLNSKLPALSSESTGSLKSHTKNKGLLLQVTTHSHLLSEPDVTQLCKALKLSRDNVNCYLLQEFDTEMDFCNKLKYVYKCYIIVAGVCTQLLFSQMG